MGGNLKFCGSDGVNQRQDVGAALCGGWCTLLRARSGYFQAMLGGDWAETRRGDGTVRVVWPQEQFSRLLRFLHGDVFVRELADLQAAVDCGTFFSVPSLLAHATDWIVENLNTGNAPSLWCFFEAEPALQFIDDKGQTDALDADAACFDFHIRNFLLLAQPLEGREGTKVPLHELTPQLMHRLLSSGLVEMSTHALLDLVDGFARTKCGLQGDEEGIPNYAEYERLSASLRPPAVLFNRQERQRLCGGLGVVEARDVM